MLMNKKLKFTAWITFDTRNALMKTLGMFYIASKKIFHIWHIDLNLLLSLLHCSVLVETL